MIPINLNEYTTAELVAELKLREGVDSLYAEPHVGYDIELPYEFRSDSGPATILIVVD